MSLVFSAILPHSPLLVPNIGKENLQHFVLTNEAKEKLNQDFSAAKVDNIIIITTKGPQLAQGLTINVSPNFRANLELFGDLVTRWEFVGELNLVGQLRMKLEDYQLVNFVTEANLDYASSIALSLLGSNLRQSILPITISDQMSLDDLVIIGQKIQEIVLESDARIALIAAADLSHRVTKKSPQGYSAKGKKFDQKIIEALKNKDLKSAIENLTIAEEVACDDLGSIILLLNLLNDTGLTAKLSSYEAPFGTGHIMLDYVSPDLYSTQSI